MRWTLEEGFVFCYLSWFGPTLTAKRIFSRFWDMADELGVPANPYRVAFTQNVVVAETDERAVEIGLPAFEGMMGYRATLEANPVFGEIAKRVGPRQLPRSLVAGAPATVAGQLAPLREAGIGGLILRFRIGEIAHADAVASQRLFMDKVAPILGKAHAEAAQ
jgi:alkanesulfonate monooxygenase SsuD/methylene tetrahydromethanopterin reductase-like flavin-dependent oxidoreductase (luciferase family)